MHMYKLIITTVTAVMMMASGVALAQDDFYGERERSQKQKRGMQSMPAVSRLMRAVRHLDLSEEQKSAVKEIMLGLKQEIRPIAGEMKANQQLLRDLIKAESFDEAAVAELADVEGNLAAQRLLITSRALAGVYAQLTDEQRAELEVMKEKRRQKMHAKREQRKGGKQSKPTADS